MKYFFSFFVFSFLLMSCSSSDDSNSNNDNQDDDPQEILLLKKVFKDGTLERQYEYYDNNKIEKETRFGAVNPLEVNYEYIADTIFERVSLKDELSFMNKSYMVNQSQARSDFYDYINESHNYRIFEFDDNGCGANLLEYFNSEGIILERINYTYDSENCSFEATFEFSDFSTGHRIYDNKKGHDESIVSEIFKRDKHHNTIENRLWNLDNEVSPSYSYNSVFEYNEEDYPVMETRTYLNGNIFVYTYEYY